MKILVLDNYDSFTFNLVHILRELGIQPHVVRNDKISVADVATFDKIMLSPGPGIPDQAGIMKEVVHTYGAEKSILGVCLGHQGIGEVFGGELYNLPTVLHGVTSECTLATPDYFFEGVPEKFQVTHYHSWAVKAENLPADLEVTAWSPTGIVMAMRHKRFDVRGVQFHPESVMTPDGKRMISNWINYKR